MYNLNKIVLNSLSEGIDEIKKIKSCLYEGYKCNVLVNRKNNYISLLRGVSIKVKSSFVEELNKNVAEQVKPLYVLVDNYSLSQKIGLAKFEFVADGFVSVLDNFIEVDEAFHLH